MGEDTDEYLIFVAEPGGLERLFESIGTYACTRVSIFEHPLQAVGLESSNASLVIGRWVLDSYLSDGFSR